MFFRSAVDSWVYAFTVSLPVVSIWGAIAHLPKAHSTIAMLTVAAAVLIAIISLSLLLFTYYRVDSTTLLVQAGPFFWRVPLDQIRAITPSRSFRSSPALSFNRLKIDYGQSRSLLVSPKNKACFIESLGFQPAEILKTTAS